MFIILLTSCNDENKQNENRIVKSQECPLMFDYFPGNTYLNEPEWFKKNDHCLTPDLKLKMEKELFSVVKRISSIHLESNRDGYQGLTILSPNNALYKKKLKLYEEKLEQQRKYFTGLYSISIPSDSNAKYLVLEKGRKGKLRTIVTERVGESGSSFSKRIYNCKNNTVKYLGSGSSFEQMNSSKADLKMGRIYPQSIAYYVKQHACNDYNSEK